MSTLHRTGSTPSNDNRPVRAGETTYVPPAGTLSRLRQLASGKGESIDLRVGGTGVKRGWRLASALCLGILLIGATAHAAPRQATPFTDQCSGDGFQIDLADAQDANLAQNPEERVEQLRDWIWPVLLARLEATAGLEGLLIGSATQPLIRDDALAHVLDHPVGVTRSGIARDGTVVVMVQVEEPAAMQEAVLEAIDQESLHLGAVPRRVLVYRYDIDQRTDHAELCRLGSFDARWIESQQQGFRRATVRQARDLESFLDGGVDLLSAQCTKQGLEVTGRVRSRVRNAPITVEHVASLHQVPSFRYVPTAMLGISFGELSTAQQTRIRNAAFYVLHPEEQQKVLLDEKSREMLSQVRYWKLLHPDVDSAELVLSWVAQRDMGQQLGFSLDPKVRSQDAVRDIDAVIAALGDPVRLAALFQSWNASSSDAVALVEISAAHDLRPRLELPLFRLRNQLRASSDHEAFGLLTKAGQSVSDPELNLLSAAMTLVNEHSMYQCARYDGPLQGTLTGMTMFYTDLLMKLWSADQFEAAPDGLIPGFESAVAHDLSGAYCTEEEDKYPHTRAWLGLREEQYARDGSERVRFAPVTTRVFIRGSQLGADHSVEVEASAEMRRFYRWWNAHYARVATWEPQYELLNQIMKWSVVVQHAAVTQDQGCMEFLDQVPVDRSQHFGQWVEKSRDLRWRGPVPLVKQGDEPTECLPLLRSRSYLSCGNERYFSGGVSAASRGTILRKLPIHVRPAPELARLQTSSPAMVTGGPVRTASAPQGARLQIDGRVRFDAVPRSDGKLTRVEIDLRQRTLTARVETAQSQRGARHSYSADGPVTGVDKSWRLDKGRLEGQDALGTRGGRFGVGQLAADDVTRGAIRVRVTPAEGAQMRGVGEAAAKQLADGKPLSRIASDLPGVTEAVRIGNNRVLVTVKGAGDRAPTHLILSSGKGIRGPPRGELTLRVGSGTGHGRPRAVQVELLSEQQARAMKAGNGAKPLARGPQARIGELEQALARGDYATAEKMIGYVRSYDVAGKAGKVLEQARRQAVRAGKDTSAIEALQIRTSIRYSRPRGPVHGSSVLPADGATFAVPAGQSRQYAELAALPPGVNPAMPAGTSLRSFHVKAIGESSTLAKAPSVVRIDGVDYTLLQRAAQVAARSGRVYAIYPCRQAGEPKSSATVECHGRAAAARADEERRAALRNTACRSGAERAQVLGVNDCTTRPQ